MSAVHIDSVPLVCPKNMQYSKPVPNLHRNAGPALYLWHRQWRRHKDFRSAIGLQGRHHLKYGHDDCSEDRTAKTRMKWRSPTIQCITWTSWMHRHHVGTREENGIWRDRHRHNRSQLTLLRLLIVYDGNGWSGESGDIEISERDHHHVIAWQSHCCDIEWEMHSIYWLCVCMMSLMGVTQCCLLGDSPSVSWAMCGVLFASIYMLSDAEIR